MENLATPPLYRRTSMTGKRISRVYKKETSTETYTKAHNIWSPPSYFYRHDSRGRGRVVGPAFRWQRKWERGARGACFHFLREHAYTLYITLHREDIRRGGPWDGGARVEKLVEMMGSWVWWRVGMCTPMRKWGAAVQNDSPRFLRLVWNFFYRWLTTWLGLRFA